jgi:hypothetical protein
METQTIYFTKQFTNGLLKGVCVIASAAFSSVDEAAKYAAIGRKGKDKFGLKSPWIIVDRSFQNYRR